MRYLLFSLVLVLSSAGCGGKGVTAPDAALIDTEPAPFPKPEKASADALATPMSQ